MRLRWCRTQLVYYNFWFECYFWQYKVLFLIFCLVLLNPTWSLLQPIVGNLCGNYSNDAKIQWAPLNSLTDNHGLSVIIDKNYLSKSKCPFLMHFLSLYRFIRIWIPRFPFKRSTILEQKGDNSTFFFSEIEFFYNLILV